MNVWNVGMVLAIMAIVTMMGLAAHQHHSSLQLFVRECNAAGGEVFRGYDADGDKAMGCFKAQEIHIGEAL